MDDYSTSVVVYGESCVVTATQAGGVWKAQGEFQKSLVTGEAGQTANAAIANWKQVVEEAFGNWAEHFGRR